MNFHLFTEDDGTEVLELDAEGMDYLETGIAQLREQEPGGSVSTPLLHSNGVSKLQLRRA